MSVPRCPIYRFPLDPPSPSDRIDVSKPPVREGSRPCCFASSRAIPESFAACEAEKKVECSRSSMSGPSVSSTLELAPVCEKTSFTIFKSSPRASANPNPSASPAVLMFITMFTSALSSGGFTRAADVSKGKRQVFEKRFRSSETLLFSGQHHVKLTFAGVSQAGSHRRLQNFSAQLARPFSRSST